MQTKNNFRGIRNSGKNGTSLPQHGNSILDAYMNKELEKLMYTFETDLKFKLQNDYSLSNEQLGRLKKDYESLKISHYKLKDKYSTFDEQFQDFKKESVLLAKINVLHKEQYSELSQQFTVLAKENQILRKNQIYLKDKIEMIRKYETISIKVTDSTGTKDLGVQHYQFAKLLKYVQTKNNIFLVGPAGSGKTTAAKIIAKALDLEFYFTGAITSEFKLTGFIDAQGRVVSTDFRKAYEKGGVFLFDEIDASFPQAILAFNAALANDFMDFPDGRIQKHQDFHCIAAANTFGTGADRQYVGRNQLDAASLDRFICMAWEIDENLERELAQNCEWTTYVQKARKAAIKLNDRIVISPRASIVGAKLLKAGISRQDVEKDVLWKGLEASRVQMIKNNITLW